MTRKHACAANKIVNRRQLRLTIKALLICRSRFSHLQNIRGIIMDQIKPGDHLEKKRWNSNPLETELKKSIIAGS